MLVMASRFCFRPCTLTSKPLSSRQTIEFDSRAAVRADFHESVAAINLRSPRWFAGTSFASVVM